MRKSNDEELNKAEERFRKLGKSFTSVSAMTSIGIFTSIYKSEYEKWKRDLEIDLEREGVNSSIRVRGLISEHEKLACLNCGSDKMREEYIYSSIMKNPLESISMSCNECKSLCFLERRDDMIRWHVSEKNRDGKITFRVEERDAPECTIGLNNLRLLGEENDR